MIRTVYKHIDYKLERVPEGKRRCVILDDADFEFARQFSGEANNASIGIRKMIRHLRGTQS